MKTDRYRRIDRLLEEALEQPAMERTAFLRQACIADATTRHELLALVDAEARAGQFLERAPDWTPELRKALATGDRIGPYSLRAVLGHGGMGTVFRARRDDGQYDQEVAIKVIRTDGPSDLRRRFRTERQILATLQHPNIARLLDGGTTDDGRPYLVMELLEGEPVDRYCQRRALSIDARLALFRTICGAVHYAHQNLLVHRDLKPTNILVSPAGEPKLLDFGIAKPLARSPALGDAVVTRTDARPMTPRYASPEQIRGEPVTTASDVYALGALLYLLLTDRHPYHAAGSDVLPHELAWAICEEAPEPPSRAVAGPPSVTGKAEQATLRERRRALRGDLDAIVSKAMAKSPGERYGSAAQLSDDLDRFSRGLPVHARPATVGERAWKLVRRHKRTAALVTTLLTTLLAFAIGTSVLALRLLEQRDRIRLEQSKAVEIMTFFVDLFQVADPVVSRGETVTVREVLEHGTERFDRELQGQPDLHAAILRPIGRVYRNLGLYAQSRQILEHSLALRRASNASGDDAEIAEDLEQLARTDRALGTFVRASSLLREAIAIERALPAGDELEIAERLTELAWYYDHTAAYEAMEDTYREALTIRVARLGPSHPAVAESLAGLGRAHWHQRDLTAAEARLREAAVMARDHLGADHPTPLDIEQLLSYVLTARGQHGAAEAQARDILARTRRIYGEGHPRLGSNLSLLAMVQHERGHYRQAEATYGEALDVMAQALGPDHPDLVFPMVNRTVALRLLGRLEECEPIYRRAIALMLQHYPADSPSVAHPMTALGSLLVDLGRAEEAESVLREALALRRTKYPDSHPQVATSMNELGGALLALGRPDEAERLLVAAVPVLEREEGPESPRTQRAYAHLVELFDRQNKPAEAAAFRRKQQP